MSIRPELLMSFGRQATVALLVLAPIPIGGRLWSAHPLWLTLALAIFAACVAHSLMRERTMAVDGLSVALAGLALFTLGQAVPLGGLLQVVSPRAAEIRELTLGEAAGPVSYEVGETLLEAMKLAVYAMLAVSVAYMCRHRSSDFVLKGVAAGGIVSMALGLLHALLGWEGLFGVWPTHHDVGILLATFANPNHAAGYLMLAGFAALALGVDGRTSEPGFALLACALFAGSLYQRSTGATAALLVGLILALALMTQRWRTTRTAGSTSLIRTLGFRTAVVMGFATVGVLGAEALIDGFSQTTLDEKWAAFRHAPALIGDHLWLGIGRGAYRSVYSAYLDEPLRVVHTHPETLPVQLMADWGAVVGSLAFVGLLLFLLRRLFTTERTKETIVLCGVTALVLQNLADFSLELTGVALSTVALTSTSRVVTASKQLRLRGRNLVAAAAGLALFAVIGLGGAARVGELRAHVRYFGELLAPDTPADLTTPKAVEVLARKHPANHFGWLALARTNASQSPPNVPITLVSVNKAIALAPTYAPPRALAAEVLWRAGVRDQALLEFRKAWTFALRPGPVIGRVLRLVDEPAQLARAMPRAIGDDDSPSATALLLAVPQAKRERGAAFARGLVKLAPPVETMDTEQRLRLARLAWSLDARVIGTTLARNVALDAATDERDAVHAATLLRNGGDTELALEFMDERASEQVTGLETCLMRASLRLQRGEAASGADILDACPPDQAPNSPSPQQKARWILLRSRADEQRGTPERALERLGPLLEEQPHDLELRRDRARYLFELGRTAEARLEANFVLRRNPDDPGAIRLLREIEHAQEHRDAAP